MLQNGEKVKIDGQEYEVRRSNANIHSCLVCDIKHCYKNKDLDAIKSHNLVTSCVDLIPLMSCFKKVE